MMMPANYSAVAENEMTYVVGGGVQVGNIIAAGPISTLTSNIITIVGNSFMYDVISNTLGVMFGGTWGVRNLYNAGTEDGLNKDDEKIRNTVWNKWTNDLEMRATNYHETEVEDGKYKVSKSGVLNAGMRVIGGLAAIAQLCVVDTSPVLADSYWLISGHVD